MSTPTPERLRHIRKTAFKRSLNGHATPPQMQWAEKTFDRVEDSRQSKRRDFQKTITGK